MSIDFLNSSSAIRNAIADYMNNETDNNSIIMNAINNLDKNNNDYGIVGNYINDYIGGNDLDNLSFYGGDYDTGSNSNLRNILFNAGRLGNALATGISSFQSQQQPNYVFTTQWLGNGLAKTNLLDKQRDKRNRLGQIFGAGDYINSLLTSNKNGQEWSLLNNDFLYNDNKYNPVIGEPRYTSSGINWGNKKDTII